MTQQLERGRPFSSEGENHSHVVTEPENAGPAQSAPQATLEEALAAGAGLAQVHGLRVEPLLAPQNPPRHSGYKARRDLGEVQVQIPDNVLVADTRPASEDSLNVLERVQGPEGGLAGRAAASA